MTQSDETIEDKQEEDSESVEINDDTTTENEEVLPDDEEAKLDSPEDESLQEPKRFFKRMADQS